ncbi:MAG: hypothetical protein ACD_81C00171G0002 [uncultured bacterium]|nr:MAG: hypothetical protein ACD_81C00171G0002 [uncultured bacterium]
MKLLTIVGARPQFIKAATVSRCLRREHYQHINEVLVHTGQHYDHEMSAQFFDELDIPRPVYNLKIGSGTHGAQVGGIMTALENVIDSERPDWVLVYGDTNSTLAAALVAAKTPLSLAHIEAGLRSHRRGMPEEVNRIVTDRFSDLLFCPTELAYRNLRSEGREYGVHLVGDVMYDGFEFYRSRLDHKGILRRYELAKREYVLATLHRAENTGDRERLNTLLRGLGKLGMKLPVIMPLHPRTRRFIKDANMEFPPSIRTTDPLPYLEILALTCNAAVITTDSGGLQKEAYFARVPCVTLRDETEWVETLEHGWNRLIVGKESALVDIADQASRLPDGTPHPDCYGDGNAAEKILDLLGRDT